MPVSYPHPINSTVDVPEEGPYYYRTFWGSYKGHVLGMMRGVMVGGAAGMFVGGVFAALFASAAMPFLPILAGITAIGATMGAHAFGNAGFVAGNAAAKAAEEELRMRYPGSGDGIARTLDPSEPGVGHHYETPPDRDKGKFFHWELGVPMAVVGLAIGGLFAFAISGGALLPMAEGALEALSFALPAMGGLLGITYGVDRARFKDVFNVTDELAQGRLGREKGKTNALELPPGVEQELTVEAKAGRDAPTITALERQEESHRLYYDYFERSFWGGIGGRFKGFMGGPIVGAALGVAVGALAFLIPGIGTGAALMIMATVTALGTEEAMTIFTEAGTQAGSNAAQEMLEVKRQRIQKGLDPEAEPEQPASAKRLFNWKAGLIGLAVGLVVGALLFPLMGGMLTTMLGLDTIMMATPAFLAPLASTIGAGTAMQVATSAAIGGLVGSTYSWGAPILKTLSRVADAIYDGRILRGDISEHREPCKIPYLAHNSPWLPRDEAGPQYKAAEGRTATIFTPQPFESEALDPAATQPAQAFPLPEFETLAAPGATPDVWQNRERPTKTYPVRAPLQDRIQQIIANGAASSESAVLREDKREAQRLADPTVAL